MGKRIVWKSRPLQQMRELELYLKAASGSNAPFFNFIEKLQPRLERISEQPESGQKTGRPRVRYIRVDDRRAVFYRIMKSKIEIIPLWDSRQEPEKNLYFPKK